MIMKRRQQDARAKRCSTEKRQQEAQAMAAQDAEACKETARCQGLEKVKWSNSYNVYVQALQWSSQAQSTP